MTPEERKIYNQKYYNNNKKDILTKLSEKINCPICNCSVRHQNLVNHQKTYKCKRIYESNNSDKIAVLESKLNALLNKAI